MSKISKSNKISKSSEISKTNDINQETFDQCDKNVM